uniref:Uncharacterized protein n=1 Tax=viral metagenome TaxID=1070528 RepID=A0A6C0DQW4_9ZZZZ
MYTLTTYLFWILLLLFILFYSYSGHVATGLVKTEEGFSGSQLIDTDSIYKIISTERLDDSDKYADVPDSGQAIQFINKKDNLFIVNPITNRPFYINNNSITIKVLLIEENIFPDKSFVATVSAKCKHCQVISDWKLYFTEINDKNDK